MKAQHTPGPWHIEDETIRANTKKDGAVTIATVRGWMDEFKDEEYANKRLIAAAPELLEALKSFVRWTELHNLNMADLINGQKCECPVVTNARAAIAKAEGK